MGIFRVHKTDKYFRALNEPFQNSSLSFAARGILAYLLSRPSSWEPRNYDLYKQSPAGRKHVDRCLKELKEAGYLRRAREQDRATGHWHWLSDIYEDKNENPDYNPEQAERSKRERSEKERSLLERSKTGRYSKDLPASTDPLSTEVGRTEGEAARSSLASVKIYQAVTKIKTVERIPEAVMEWLEEQDQYMDGEKQEQAFRRAIIAADKDGKAGGEKHIFDAGMLEFLFDKEMGFFS